MIQGISFYDVLTIPEFCHLHMVDLLPNEMDARVAPYLYKLGVDVNHVVLIQACKHRRDSGEIVTGYRYVGRERTDKTWLDCIHSSMAARVDSQKDKHLAADMLLMSKEGQDWRSFKQMAIAAAADINGALDYVQKHGFEEEKPEPTWRDDLEQIRVLQALQKQVRGYLHPDEDTLNPPKGIL